MSTYSPKSQKFYSECFEDLVNYQEHFISQRKQYTATQLSVFLYVILGSFLIYANNHIPLPVAHGLLSTSFLFCGFVFSIAIFNVNLLIQRKWQLGVSFTIENVQKKLDGHHRYAYSIDSGILEAILLATLLGLFIFSLIAWLTVYFIAASISIVSTLIFFAEMKRRIHKTGIESKETETNYAVHDDEIAELEKIWARQQVLIGRMKSVNNRLNVIRKTLLTLLVVGPAVLLFDIFFKDINVSIRLAELYVVLLAVVFNIVILSVWRYDLVENQSDAKRIYAEGVQFERLHPALPQLWQNMVMLTSENYVVWHMTNLYLFPLVLSLAISTALIWFTSYESYVKVIISVGICGIALFAAGRIIRESLVKK